MQRHITILAVFFTAAVLGLGAYVMLHINNHTNEPIEFSNTVIIKQLNDTILEKGTYGWDTCVAFQLSYKGDTNWYAYVTITESWSIGDTIHTWPYQRHPLDKYKRFNLCVAEDISDANCRECQEKYLGETIRVVTNPN